MAFEFRGRRVSFGYGIASRGRGTDHARLRCEGGGNCLVSGLPVSNDG